MAYHSITLSLIDRDQQDLGADPLGLIAEAARYGDQKRNDLILLIAHHLRLSGHQPDDEASDLLAGDLDAFQALDPDD